MKPYCDNKKSGVTSFTKLEKFAFGLGFALLAFPLIVSISSLFPSNDLITPEFNVPSCDGTRYSFDGKSVKFQIIAQSTGDAQPFNTKIDKKNLIPKSPSKLTKVMEHLPENYTTFVLAIASMDGQYKRVSLNQYVSEGPVQFSKNKQYSICDKGWISEEMRLRRADLIDLNP